MNHTPVDAYILIGLGREGFSSYQFVRSQHPDTPILAYDDKNVLEKSENWQKIAKNDEKIQFFHEKSALLTVISQQKHTQRLVALKTPGIPNHHPVVAALHSPEWSATVHWTSNTSLFFAQIAELKNSSTQIVTIGVTGTKGKSTTTSSIHHLLHTAGLPCLLGGNIGKPPLDLLPELKQLLQQPRSSTHPSPIFVVLELSSHQLSDLSVSPNIAVIQEIVPEHLDYYPNFEAYVEAKSHIARAQHADDTIIYNSQFALPSQLAQLSAARHRPFTTDSAEQELSRIIPLSQLPLKGKHNVLNVMPTLLIAREYGLSTEVVKAALLSFRPLPHRLEFVARQRGVDYYNDSLSTTPDAAIAALASFPNSHVILLAGGFDRHLDYTQLGQQIIAHGVKAVVLFPTTGVRIRSAVESAAAKANAPLPKLVDASNMDEAVKKARSLATDGDTVLLSPASASFNMYRDYQERGEAFKRSVRGPEESTNQT